jgi:hypothetical protein
MHGFSLLIIHITELGLDRAGDYGPETLDLLEPWLLLSS